MQYDRVWSYIESGKKEGARLLVGGEKRQGKGFYADPTIFSDIRSDMKIVRVVTRLRPTLGRSDRNFLFIS